MFTMKRGPSIARTGNNSCVLDPFCRLKVVSGTALVQFSAVSVSTWHPRLRSQHHAAMPPRARVTDRTLHIKRAPHAFAFFLAHMKSRCRMHKGVRLKQKTTVWRMDLLSARYKLLDLDERKHFKDLSEKAFRQTQDRRATALAHTTEVHTASATPPESSKTPAVAEITSGTVADHRSRVWLSLPVPTVSPSLDLERELTSAVAEAMPPSTEAWPQSWSWVDPRSGVRRELHAERKAISAGTYGICLGVKDTITSEAYCLKVPRAASGIAASKEMLRREYETLSRLSHTNVVAGFAWVSCRDGEVDGFIMQLGCGNLCEWLGHSEACSHGDGDSITRGHGVSILVQIARALSYIHLAGIAHLDLKPENIISFASTGAPPMVRLADFGTSMRGPRPDGSAGDRVASDMVNTSTYRPLHLYHAAASEVNVQYTFDLWAFGCVVFDVLQRHPRWRSRDGRLLRLFSEVNMGGDYIGVLRIRNYRLSKMIDKVAVTLVVRLQPDRPSQCTRGRGAVPTLGGDPDRLMRADLVQAVMDLRA